ncbi:hypothetical protein D0B54_15565 [Solimonas sp. K1W22B-7]|uniref:hypothetical protein n=1 Tax=Solimonas sp. K1W22B-7 TaxID=2303331 RepID=UPI000E337A81|nr:hypothetical protein [Solimonas sp. K1W22B-7]AXQ30003.1 hypothetical protein D0B54_15565 [Solimonas sp. K1W22B-7]
MKSRLWLLPAFLLAGCGAGGGSDGGAGAAADGKTLYVSAQAADGGDGSRQHPFDSLADIEQASAPGDTLVVLPAPLDVAPLEGGIALQAGQRLIGGGPAVVQRRADAAIAGASALAALPRIANSNPLRQGGDAVRLAPGSEVRNLVIAAASRGGIYGLNVPGTIIRGNDVSGTNTRCAVGFTVERFTAPTRLPYFGVPLILPAGWAGIMVDADEGKGEVRILDNHVHHAACGNGIDLRIKGSADYRADLSGNFVTELHKGPLGETRELHLVHAITTQITDNARLEAVSVNNTQTFIGGPGADCEGLFMNLADNAFARWTIDRNIFEHGIGGFSCNGMEAVISHGPAHGEMSISNSRFVDNPGDMLQQDNLGSGSTLILELDRVIVRDTTERPGSPDAQPLPFNLGECILAGSDGADNTTVLRVRDSEFSNCNNGLTILSGVSLLNGGLSDGLIDVEIVNSSFRNNAYNNLVVGVIAPLRELRLRVENSDFRGAGDSALAFKRIDLGRIETASVDFGGGTLGSRGGNCIAGGASHDATTEGLDVLLRGNWWGRAGGPDSSRLTQRRGSLDTGAPLGAAPARCAAP